jgi:hypothetical protein
MWTRGPGGAANHSLPSIASSCSISAGQVATHRNISPRRGASQAAMRDVLSKRYLTLAASTRSLG